MNYNLVDEAKYKIYNSELMKYTTTERVEKSQEIIGRETDFFQN